MSFTARILARVEAHLAKHGVSERSFGLAVAGDHKLLHRLRSGRTITSRTVEAIDAYLEGRAIPARALAPQHRRMNDEQTSREKA